MLQRQAFIPQLYKCSHVNLPSLFRVCIYKYTYTYILHTYNIYMLYIYI